MRASAVAPWLLVVACSTTHGVGSARAPSAENADAAPSVEAATGSTPSAGDADAPVAAPLDATTTAAQDAQPQAAADAGARSCDTRNVTCRRAQPVCGELEAPAVEDGCWGPCVPIAECACTVADDCPDRDRFTCHLYAAHCGPYVR
jgi:hypothetical protein